jgi:hypothetical protein
MSDDAPPFFVLCDFAEVLNGKLYIMGGGFNQVIANVPFPVALAVLWNVPWDQANRQHALEISLVTEDGDAVNDAEGNPIRIQGSIEVGRPAGMKRGDPIAAPLAVRTPPLTFAPGGYTWKLSIDSEVVSIASLRAIQVPG